MARQYLLCTAFLATLLVPHILALAIEPGACDERTLNCTGCRALAPDCAWFVSLMDGTGLCANATGGEGEGYEPFNKTCSDDSPDGPTTTVFPTTTEPPTTEPPTTEPPTTEPPTTEPPTTEPPTTEPPTTEPPTTEPPTTEPPTTEPPTTEAPTTEPPTTEAPTETPTAPPPTTDAPTTVGPAPTPAPTPAPRTGGFSFGSFVGGMVFCLVILAGGFVGLKIYRRRQAMAGRYNNL